MPNKKLGQHWLKDRLILEAIADSAELSSEDTALEIGPGLGTLTSVLLGRAKKVIAIEYDAELAKKLPGQFPGKSLEVINEDILQFDTASLPKGYKVVANVPYYITQKIVEKFLHDNNQPNTMVLLVQREVAEKLAAQPGKLTAISVKLQYRYNVQLGTRVQKEYFIPAPNVESQVVICNIKHVDKYVDSDIRRLYRVIDAGFSAPRKKIKASLAGGLGLSKDVVEQSCREAGINADDRPGAVAVEKWVSLAKNI